MKALRRMYVNESTRVVVDSSSMSDVRRIVIPACLLTVTMYFACVSLALGQPRVQMNRQGNLEYASDELDNKIPDFSTCGYEWGNKDIPDVDVMVVVYPVEGDDTKRIQAAIDYVSRLPLKENGFRGAIRLAPGKFEIASQLRIESSGIVLQGSGSGEEGTLLTATGTDRRALISVSGVADRELMPSHSVVDEYVPVGSNSITVEVPGDFSVGDNVLVTRPCTKEWIEFIGVDSEGVSWKPNTRNIYWDRTVSEVNATTITLDSPITTAMERRFGGGTVQQYRWPGRIAHVGIEDLLLRSEATSARKSDEDHAWYGVTLDSAQNAWLRRLSFQQFSGGAVQLGPQTRAITVEDCISTDPISEQGGYRRHTFFTMGQLALFNRCWSEHGIHDFSVGHCAAGPTAFVQCFAKNALGPSGPIESWCSGVLYDNTRIDGSNLELRNRWSVPRGTGWAAANCVLWQCRAANVLCFRPPGANNWAFGNWANHLGDGAIASSSDFVKPQSLYQAQLNERVGKSASERLDPILGLPVGATNPSLEQAARFVKQSGQPARTVKDVIEENMARVTNQRSQKGIANAKNIDDLLPTLPQSTKEQVQTDEGRNEPAFQIENGWLVTQDRVVTGRRLTPSWWRGTIRREEAIPFGHNISRFAPGRTGLGLTELPLEIAEDLSGRGYAAYEHHYGLWYERRRDDHLMVRRADGSVEPPFYEQPFARTGEGTAWDGLSKYDLTKYNPWYWNRLSSFAELCGERGIMLVHHNYFQHNILEAGAHWADCPWRPANNVNELELPEPPPYIGDKRLFMAHNFYDVSRPSLRKHHRLYIRQCLDAFEDQSNVIQTTSAEFTGPLEFVQFWLDTIVEWEEEHNKDVKVALSCTKDVQDAILADDTRQPHVDIIDIRYWTYDKNLKVYAPEGGKNLAPRQHMRQMRSESSSFDSIVHAVREYRAQFPDKVVLYNADRVCRSPNEGWAVLMGGGSLANVNLPQTLAKRIVGMRANATADTDQKKLWCLSSGEGELLFHFPASSEPLDLSKQVSERQYSAQWIDVRSGEVVQTEELGPSDLKNVTPTSKALWLMPK